MDDENIVNFSCDCTIFIYSDLISNEEVVQSLCEEYVRYKLSSGLNEHTSIVMDNEHVEAKPRVKINSASENELKQLPGINLVHAKKIIQSREHYNYINSWEDLMNLGIDPVSVENLKSLVIIDKVNNSRVTSGGRILDL